MDANVEWAKQATLRADSPLETIRRLGPSRPSAARRLL